MLIFRPQGMGLLVLLKPGSPIAQSEWALLDGSGKPSWETRACTACMSLAGVGMSVPILEAVARIPHNTHSPIPPQAARASVGTTGSDDRHQGFECQSLPFSGVFGVNAKDASLPSGSFWGAT